jgi:hypothetical protein
VRLFEHPDFDQAILQAAQHLGVSEQFVEKDYYVTDPADHRPRAWR